MKTPRYVLWLLCLLSLWAVLSFAQGPLTPPGPPGPTMKTLTQIEPRTLISSVPFTITQPGSYYLTGDLTGSSGQNGIVIQVSNVTLDLNGFSIVGCANGIEATSGNGNGTVIRNGTVRGCSGVGVNLANATKAQLERVVVCNNGSSGIVAGNASMVSLCTVSENTGPGVDVGDGSTVASCIVRSNASDGILVSSNCRAAENISLGNGTSTAHAGIHATGAGNRVEGNTLTRNNGRGIKVDGTDNLIIKNSAHASVVTDYDIATGNSYGQILVAPGAGFVNSNPWANFSTTCPAGQSMCSGACINLATSPNNCGACGNGCSGNNMASISCAGGACSGTCAPGFGDCNSDKRTDGCETALNNDPNNCGSCGNVCTRPNAVAGCAGGACTITSCNSGFGNCDNQAANGCETALNSPNNCGGCGVVCSGNHMANVSCDGVSCNGVCAAGFADCNNNKQTDGCETGVNTDPSNCGTCGNVCTRPNATSACNVGVCRISSCISPFRNCDGQDANGCEVNSLTDPNDCGACGVVCSNNNMASRSCNGGVCGGLCASGFADCNNNKQTDGCETAVSTDVSNCGGCGVVCSNNNMANRSCNGGVCGGLCAPGFADCNSNKQTDGCETNISADRNNCGGCGIVCAGFQSCTGGVCL